MFPLLVVEYRNYTEKNGFKEVILPQKVGIKKERTGHPLSVSFVFINEVYIRFKSVSLMELGSETTSRFLQVSLLGDDSNYAALHLLKEVESELPYNTLAFEPNNRFFRVIDDKFRKFLINDDNIHEYIFRIFRRLPYNDKRLKPFFGLSIIKHDKTLPKHDISPADCELLVGETNGFWTDSEQKLAKKFRSFSIDFAEPPTREQFIVFFAGNMDKKGLSRAARARIEVLWARRREMGIL
jgi:hypothetical protein|tara:strand:- start:3654 stop:4373 length:720 start_codon:yes stop_codon:yes gene_type:complete